MTWRETGKHYPQIEDALNLKICDLCGALNLSSDCECVVCRWHGHFEQRPEVVRIALEFHMQRQMASDLRSYSEEPVMAEDRIGLAARLSSFWNNLRRRLAPRRF